MNVPRALFAPHAIALLICLVPAAVLAQAPADSTYDMAEVMIPTRDHASSKYIVLAGIDFAALAPEVLATAANFAQAPGCELRETGRSRLWCDRHTEHHPRAHVYSEIPSSYGLGSQTFQ